GDRVIRLRGCTARVRRRTIKTTTAVVPTETSPTTQIIHWLKNGSAGTASAIWAAGATVDDRGEGGVSARGGVAGPRDEDSCVSTATGGGTLAVSEAGLFSADATGSGFGWPTVGTVVGEVSG